MARYIVEDHKTSKYEKNYKFPMINLIPAIVWSIPVFQKVLPIIGTAGAYGVAAAFIMIYVILSYTPVIALMPGVAGVIMMTAMLWTPADHIDNTVVRIIVKVVILAIITMIELCMVINATLPWLERKFPAPPRIRKVED